MQDRAELKRRVLAGLKLAAAKGALLLEETGWANPEDWDAVVEPIVDTILEPKHNGQ